jgi:hypothetical protein
MIDFFAGGSKFRPTRAELLLQKLLLQKLQYLKIGNSLRSETNFVGNIIKILRTNRGDFSTNLEVENLKTNKR